MRKEKKSFFKDNINVILGFYSVISFILLVLIIFYTSYSLINAIIFLSLLLSSIIISLINLKLWKMNPNSNNFFNKMGFIGSLLILIIFILLLIVLLIFLSIPKVEM